MVEFEAIADCGESPITLDLLKFRDPYNVTLGGFVKDDGLLKIDLLAPVITDVTLANNTVFPITGENYYTKFADALVLTAHVEDPGACTPAGSLVISADLSPLGRSAAAIPSYNPVTHIATWSFTTNISNPALDASHIKLTVSATDLLLNTGTGQNATDIVLDNTLPVAASELYAHPKGKHTNLTWTAGSDVNFYRYFVKYNKPSEYPTFASVGVYTYPTETPMSGFDALAPVGPEATTNVMTDNLSRDMFYFRIYTMDKAANISTSSTATERATNYYLGDFGSGEGAPPGSTLYDGYVDGFDLNWFSGIYWTVNPTGVTAEGDIAPTDASVRSYMLPGHRFGIPHPDGQIEFEDLMIFSMNYANVAPKASAPVNATISKDFALNMQQNASGSELDVTVKLENNGTDVKGASVVLSFDAQVLKVKDVTSGTLFGEAGSQAFFASKIESGLLRIDGATMGTGRTVAYSGNLATVRFEVLGTGDPGLVFGAARLRDGENRNIVAKLKSTSTNAPQGFALSQNFPNPFTPTTTIAYQVAENATVTIDVYNALGAKVAAIVNGTHDAGSYQVQLDASGLPSGLYYYTMRAGSFTATRSMTITK